MWVFTQCTIPDYTSRVQFFFQYKTNAAVVVLFNKEIFFYKSIQKREPLKKTSGQFWKMDNLTYRKTCILGCVRPCANQRLWLRSYGWFDHVLMYRNYSATVVADSLSRQFATALHLDPCIWTNLYRNYHSDISDLFKRIAPS